MPFAPWIGGDCVWKEVQSPTAGTTRPASRIAVAGEANYLYLLGADTENRALLMAGCEHALIDQRNQGGHL